MANEKQNNLLRTSFWAGRILLNICVWLIVWDMLYNNNNKEHPVYFHDFRFWIHIIILQTLFLLLVYGNSFFLVPKLIKRKKYGYYLLAFFTHGILFALVIGGLADWLLNIYPGVPNYCFSSISFEPRSGFDNDWSYYLNFYLSTILTTQFMYTPGWLIDYLSREKLSLQQKKKKKVFL